MNESFSKLKVKSIRKPFSESSAKSIIAESFLLLARVEVFLLCLKFESMSHDETSKKKKMELTISCR